MVKALNLQFILVIFHRAAVLKLVAFILVTVVLWVPYVVTEPTEREITLHLQLTKFACPDKETRTSW